MSVTDLLKTLFKEHGWAVATRERLAEAGLDFDLMAESDTVVAFARALPVDSVATSVDGLSAQLATLTLSRVDAKSWEAYLLLLVGGIHDSDVAALQETQRDLNYCRKVIVSTDQIVSSEQPLEALRRALSLFFPLDVFDGTLLPDVRALLVDELIRRRIRPTVARSLVSAFDTPECGCLERIMEPAGG